MGFFKNIGNAFKGFGKNTTNFFEGVGKNAARAIVKAPKVLHTVNNALDKGFGAVNSVVNEASKIPFVGSAIKRITNQPIVASVLGGVNAIRDTSRDAEGAANALSKRIRSTGFV